jgi:hypothetical protein
VVMVVVGTLSCSACLRDVLQVGGSACGKLV